MLCISSGVVGGAGTWVAGVFAPEGVTDSNIRVWREGEEKLLGELLLGGLKI